MQRISIQEFQRELLHLLEIVDSICTQHSIPYWIDGGTLIGAIRHKGFIPWDDDLDVCFLKKDYDRVLPLLHDFVKKNNSYVLMYGNVHGFNNWCEYFGNLRVVGEKPFGKGFFPCHIDLIPVKAVINSADELLRDKKITCVSNYYFRGEVKYPQLMDFKPSKRKKDAFAEKKQFSLDFEQHLNRNMQNPQDCLLNYSFGDSFVKKEREYYAYKEVFPTKKYLFEGKWFVGPNDADSYLKKLYVNYMSLPDVKQQVPFMVGYYRLDANYNEQKLQKSLNAQYSFFYDKNTVSYALKRSISYFIRLDFSLVKQTIKRLFFS